MSRPTVDFAAKARAAWGEQMPDWVAALAAECSRTTQTRAAQRIGYSDGLVSGVLSNKYPGDIARVEAKVRGALMSAVVSCPVLGEIGLDRCLDEQNTDDTGASSVRSRLFRKCRGIGMPKCEHSRIKREGDNG